MIIPQYWAEGRAQDRRAGRQVTVRRLGWSDVSQSEAQAHADVRAREALQRVIAGEKLLRAEPKVPYNGAAGVPIREEIVSRHGESVVTRNGYGARCLNTPRTLFADVDFAVRPPFRTTLVVFVLLASCAWAAVWLRHSYVLGGLLAGLALLGAHVTARGIHGGVLRLAGGAENAACRRIARATSAQPSWGVRIYRTPAGLRVVATHQPYDPSDPAVIHFFRAIGTDPVYARMCMHQQCFRARLSPKPWRIGIEAHMKPRPGVWPVSPERMAVRAAWVRDYERAAQSYAACSFIESVGNLVVHHEIAPVVALHDTLSKAHSGLPIA